MSMLTPPGMGGQYRITGDKYPRMRRPRRRGRLVLALAASVVALGLIGWGTVQLVDVFSGGDTSAAAGAKGECTSRKNASGAGAGTGTKAAAGTTTAAGLAATVGKDVPKPGDITVNVLNATTRKGLAKETADELKKRGFRIGTVGNATAAYDKKVKGAGVLLGAKAAAKAALPVLGTQLPGAELKTDGRAKAAEVDLVIGGGYKELAPRTAADKALAVLAEPRPAPSAKKDC
ncbi:LytR C-terminal domain-containing protein [Streptomyces sp. NPDC008313]|uniref:LytR C-terminal domain-containing protein n=1 Tax=Streptomyces sp. NPDC008313 TaxID=3364826 RepID=UPI0036E95BC2